MEIIVATNDFAARSFFPTAQKGDFQNYVHCEGYPQYCPARHAGFGLGFERCVMYLTGMGNIRDVIPFPRTVNNCEL